jgi:3-oxoadipate enol-lactonase
MRLQEQQGNFAQVNGTELYYEVKGTGHPFTLIHGLLLDRRSWDEQFVVFAEDYKMVRYDIRGWGDSAQEKAGEQFSPRQDLLSLLEYLKIDKTYLLGLSGGGTLALDFTIEHPEKVEALILIAAGLSGYELPMTESIQAFANQYYGALQQKDSAGAAEATVKFWTDGPRRRPEEVNAEARRRISEMTREHIERHGDFMGQGKDALLLEPAANSRLAEVKVPVLIVVGDEDNEESLEVADRLEQGISGAKKVVLHGVAHHPHMEQPEEFNRVVLDFLRSI